MSNNQGQSLIFLISQPRSGSTMTQRILGAHSLIHTQSEPWILLHPLNALKPGIIQPSYNIDLYIKGLNDFIAHLPGTETQYIETISKAYLSLYNSILNKNNKKYFLDKTPRYYLIIKELISYFPKAKFILLWRNPASVLTSIVKSWSKADWFRLSEWSDDLILAPEMMIKGRSLLGDKCFNLVYEDLISKPEQELERLFVFLNIPFDRNIIQYGNSSNPKWIFGDQVTINQKNQPDISHKDNWINHLDDPQLWRVLDDYVKKLGKSVISKMGYSYEEILTTLEKNKPNIDITNNSLPLILLLRNNRDSLIEAKRLRDKLFDAGEGIKRREVIIEKRDEYIKQLTNLIQDKDINIAKVATELNLLRDKLNERSNHISILNTEINKLKENLDKYDVKIEALNSSIELKDKIIYKNHQTLNHLQERINETESKLAEKEKLISKDSYKSKLLLYQKDTLEKENEQSRYKIETLAKELQISKTQIKNKDNAIKELKLFINNIERSYTFRIGSFFIWPFRKMKNTFYKQ